MPFTPVTFTDGVTPLNKATFDALQAGVIAAERTENKAAANGYASLDASALVPVAQLPLTPIVEMATTAAQSITASTMTKAAVTALNASNHPGSNLAADAANNRVNVLVAGWYLVVVAATWAVNAGASRLLVVYMNGTAAGEYSRLPLPGGFLSERVTTSAVIRIPAGNSVEARVYQDTGSPLNLNQGILTVAQLSV